MEEDRRDLQHSCVARTFVSGASSALLMCRAYLGDGLGSRAVRPPIGTLVRGTRNRSSGAFYGGCVEHRLNDQHRTSFEQLLPL